MKGSIKRQGFPTGKKAVADMAAPDLGEQSFRVSHAVSRVKLKEV